MYKTYLIKDSLDFFMLPGTLDILFSRLRLFPVMLPSFFQRDVSMVAYRFALQFVGSTSVERCKLKVRMKVRWPKNAQKLWWP